MTQTSNNSGVSVEKLAFNYENKPIFNNLNINFSKNHWTAIIGSNGSGKTTLLRLIAGLEEATSGTINTFGQKPSVVFQNPDTQFFSNTVEDDIAFTLENMKVNPSKMSGIIQTTLNSFGIAELAKKNPQELSGGQKQKVALISAIVSNSEILLLDEVTSMLDPYDRQIILETIRNLTGQTIISISHDAEEIMMADTVVVLKDGKVIAQDAPVKILSDKKIVKDNHLPISKQSIYSPLFNGKIPKKVLEVL
ncbi:MAG: ATP-binding cassette domain-containing protein [Lactobacillaceae bacterium]|jgi:energy-coupling factor transport system ATP-binding protein|nr:ATP-binding cassette domain-containing protein [Lactobacillaceae bacterium]